MGEQVLIRVDANETMGMGHFVRCLALGEMLKSTFDVNMVMRQSTQDTRNKTKESGLKFLEIKEENNFIQAISPSDIVVLDGYDFNAEYQNSIRARGCRLVYIDDMGNGRIPADVIINPGPGITEVQYEKEPYTKVYTGTDYTLLRKEFREYRNTRIPSEITTAFICFGGADFYNLTSKVLRALENCFQINRINVVVGSAFQHEDKLNADVQRLTGKDVRPFKNLDSGELINLISGSDIALVSSSGIMLECFAVGIACVTGAYADNQKNYAAFAKKNGAAEVIDNWLNASENVIANSVNGISNGKAAGQIRIQKQLIDGRSNIRLPSIFLKLRPSGALEIKRAKPEDVNLFFDWANEPDVRRNSINTDPIPWESHVAWFNSKINSPGFIFYILYENYVPVGQIRFDAHDSYFEINFSIDRDHRGKGFGKAIVVLGMNELLAEKGNDIKFRAKVKTFNQASMKTFQSLGFKLINTSEDIAYFQYE